MAKAIETLRSQLVGFRSGTISPAFVDSIKVMHEGQPTPIKHLAFSQPGKTGISVTPHDPALVGSIAKTLTDAGLNAYVFSKVPVAVSVPPISGDEKQRVHARIRALGEEAKISVRNLRKKLKAEIDSALGQDERLRAEKHVQELTDAHIAQIDRIVSDKIASI